MVAAPLVQAGRDVAAAQAAAKNHISQQEHLTLSIKKIRRFFSMTWKLIPRGCGKSWKVFSASARTRSFFCGRIPKLSYGFVIKLLPSKAAGVEKLGMVTVPPEEK